MIHGHSVTLLPEALQGGDALSWEGERNLEVHKLCSAASVWVLRDGAHHWQTGNH